MNTAEPRRRWRPRSVRARTALAVASTAAVILVAIGWWLHHDVYRQSARIAEDQARDPLLALADQLREGVIPSRRSAVPYEVVATGRGTPVASGGGMDVFAPGARPVLPAPPALSEPVDTGSGWYYTTIDMRIPERTADDLTGGFDLVSRTYPVLYTDIWAGELSSAEAAALGVDADATLRVHVVVLPHTAEAITHNMDLLLLRAGLVSLVLISAVTYFTVRNALRPVEAIRVITASVTANDPRERVTVPATGHEIAALATTINTTLQRLDEAAARQRRFVADAAHELRSPLTTLLASLEVALAYPERTDWPGAVATAARQTGRLQALAEDLLLLARLDSHAPTTAAWVRRPGGPRPPSRRGVPAGPTGGTHRGRLRTRICARQPRRPRAAAAQPRRQRRSPRREPRPGHRPEPGRAGRPVGARRRAGCTRRGRRAHLRTLRPS